MTTDVWKRSDWTRSGLVVISSHTTAAGAFCGALLSLGAYALLLGRNVFWLQHMLEYSTCPDSDCQFWYLSLVPKPALLTFMCSCCAGPSSVCRYRPQA